MVLSPLTGSCFHGDNTLMGLWGLECLLSSPWAQRADIQRSHNLYNRGGRNGALLIPPMLLHLPQCISTMGRILVAEGSASLLLPQGGTWVHWSFAWRLASRFACGTVPLICDLSSPRKKYTTTAPPSKKIHPLCLVSGSSDLTSGCLLAAGISHHYLQMPPRLGLEEYSGLVLRGAGVGVGGVVHRGPRVNKICSLFVLYCSTTRTES